MHCTNLLIYAFLAAALVFAPTFVSAYETIRGVRHHAKTKGKTPKSTRKHSRKVPKSKEPKSKEGEKQTRPGRVSVGKCDLYLWWQDIVSGNNSDDSTKKAINCFSGNPRYRGATTDLCPKVPLVVKRDGRCGEFFEESVHPQSFCANVVQLDPMQARELCYGYEDYKCSCYNACVKYLTDVSGFASSGGTCCQNLCPGQVIAATSPPPDSTSTTMLASVEATVEMSTYPAVQSTAEPHSHLPVEDTITASTSVTYVPGESTVEPSTSTTFPPTGSNTKGSTRYTYPPVESTGQTSTESPAYPFVESTTQGSTSYTYPSGESTVQTSTGATYPSAESTGNTHAGATFYAPIATGSFYKLSGEDYLSTSTPVETTLVG